MYTATCTARLNAWKEVQQMAYQVHFRTRSSLRDLRRRRTPPTNIRDHVGRGLRQTGAGFGLPSGFVGGLELHLEMRDDTFSTSAGAFRAPISGNGHFSNYVRICSPKQ